ncbi:endonuclease MutS2 [Trichothermofontia sichuanensis B231]|uniref:endonuclease MutS2 n=1 Tax=Trichothermofontia sichuanensis TaxID=3045816 RepID=UPI00224693C5|nr:endonuclease MutS2 [Trichothermofontia sichuanensis]UZQ53758.1 endonuclease MutS2 [Trichothermofontia sichuanensis B231]
MAMSVRHACQTETLDLLEWPRLCQHLATFAATKLGALAAQHLRIPTTPADSLVLLAQTREVYQLEVALPQGLSFAGISDIGAALERAARQGILLGEELLAIATTLAGSRQLRRLIDQHNHPGELAAADTVPYPVLGALVAELRTYPELEQAIHRCIDDQGQVSDRASPTLARIREKQRHLREDIQRTLQQLLQRQAHAIQEPIITQRDDRFVIPVKFSHKDAIPGIVHDTSASGATLYVEPYRVVDRNNQLRQLVRQEQAEAEAIRQALSQQVAEVAGDLERLLAIVTTLDLATARARYSLWLEANPPRFIDPQAGETLTLRELRHPLLVWQQRHENGHAVVPIDLRVTPNLRVVTITGPNTGGKTVTLKTLGLAVLMAKVGLFVPAREPVELPWFAQVLADIGDEQSLQQNLSTFSGHIRRISRILTALAEADPLPPSAAPATLAAPALASGLNPSGGQAGGTPSPLPQPVNALVLLDEIGAGTDPTEGSALAKALLHYLADHAGLTIATTHYGELKALKYQDDRFENAAVEFDEATLSPTYRLLWGIPGRSNALTIAQRLGLNPEIVAAAKQQLAPDTETDVNQVIAGLEDQRRQQEAKARAASQLLEQAERLHREVADKAAMLRERERQLQQVQEQTVQQAIAAAKQDIARVIRKLQQGPQTAQAAQRATKALQAIADKHLPPPPPVAPPSFMPQVGDKIRIPRLNVTAEVLSGPDPSGALTVRFGLMKMTVALEEIESLQGEKPQRPLPEGVEPRPKPVATPAPAEPAIRTSRNTLDVRGMRVADAEVELDRALAQAHGPLWVIHGHGTGRLRRGIHAFLEQHPQVDRFEPAEAADGGSGVTVVYPTP